MIAAAPKSQGELVAEVWTAIEATDVETIYAAPLVLLSSDQPTIAVIGLHVGRRRFRLSVEDARLLAEVLLTDTGLVGSADLARGLFAAAGVAELLLLADQMRRLRRSTEQQASRP